MLWFIFCIAVLNMLAGFGLAVFLAGATVGGNAVTREEPPDDSFEDEFLGDVNSVLGDAVPTEAPVEPATETPVKANDEKEAADDPGLPDTADVPADVSDTSAMADLDAAVSAALGDGELSEGTEGATSDSEEAAETGGKNPLQSYHSQLESFCEELAALDDRLRTKRPESTSELKVELESVAECNTKQTEACEEAEQSLRNMMDAEGVDETRGEAILAAIREEREEAVVTAEAFEQLDLDGDIDAQCNEVLDRTAKLLGANHDLRDQVSDMIASTQSSGDEKSGNAAVDPLTQLMSRSALDASLVEHWEKDPHRARAVSLAILDIDAFTKLNRTHGPTVGNRMLRALARLLENEVPAECRVARFAGQRFALLGIDRDLKQAVSDAEKVRQIIETVRFEYKDHDLEATASCGVVTADRDDTQDSLYARAIESVREAKRYGRNRTFVHEGEYPTPVVPPNFTLTEKHVTV